MNTIRARIAMAVLRHRGIAWLLFGAVTLFFAVGLKNVTLETVFSDLLPKDDPFIHVFKDHPNFGNPLTYTIMVKNKNGDIYNPDTLQKVWNLTRDIDLTPGVDHDQILSIASSKARYATATPFGIDAQPLMGDSVPKSSEEIAQTMQLSTEQTTLASDKASAAQSSSQTTRDSISNTSRTIDSLRNTLNAAAQTNSALNEQCAHISDAMRSITAVAEQTNLLALNAAIESARAGEHGRGFAVVADEVRTLAIRSKESADQITSITEQLVAQTASSVEQMQTCIQLVDEAVVSSDNATSAMTQIMQQIREASESMTEIATSAVEQETASSSIAQSTARLSEFTSEELATAESLAGEVEVLSQISQRMRSAIERFKL